VAQLERLLSGGEALTSLLLAAVAAAPAGTAGLIQVGNQWEIGAKFWPRSWANFSLSRAVFPQECMGQLASFGPA
jgi:hypothetical protein